MDKRRQLEGQQEGQLVKRARHADGDRGARNGQLTTGSLPRTSSLRAPIIELKGHTADVYAARFDTGGQNLASASGDRAICLWQTFGNNENYGVLSGSKGAVLDVHWSRDSQRLFSACADATISSWDVESGTRIKRLRGHTSVVNSIDVLKWGSETIASACDDRSIGMWDARQKSAIEFLDDPYPVTSVAFDDVGSKLFSAGIEGKIKMWDLRKMQVVQQLEGHTDIVTSLSLSPNGQLLLSNAMDSTVRTWDVRPFAAEDRQLAMYTGAPAGLEKNLIRASWNADSSRIAAGSGDHTVVVWDVDSAKILYKLPGHKGCVTDVRFHPEEPIILSSSCDRGLIMGEVR